MSEAPRKTVRLLPWLAQRSRRPLWTAERKQRWHVLRAAGVVLQRLHQAGCTLSAPSTRGRLPLRVQLRPKAWPSVVVGNVEAVRAGHQVRPAQARRDVAALRQLLVRAGCSRTDQLRFLLGYLNARRLTPALKRQLRLSPSACRR